MVKLFGVMYNVVSYKTRTKWIPVITETCWFTKPFIITLLILTALLSIKYLDLKNDDSNILT